MKSGILLDTLRVRLMLEVQKKISWGKNELLTLIDRQTIEVLKDVSKNVNDLEKGKDIMEQG